MLRHVELFAGVGGFRQALDALSCDFDFQQATVAFSEIDEHAVRSYQSAYSTEGEKDIGDIAAFTSEDSRLRSLPPFNLLSGGFPCQPFSMMGNQKGFDDHRGGMFFHAAAVLRTYQPHFVLLENVRHLQTHDKGRTLRRIVDELHACGYPNVYWDAFNTHDFGLAQIRNRLYIFAAKDVPNAFVFSRDAVKESFDEIFPRTSLRKQQTTHDVLEKQVEAKYYLSEKIKPTILASGSGSFVAKSTINDLVAKPLTATMVKMHRACQDNYYSDGYIQSNDPVAYSQITFSTEELQKQPIRRLTPREAFMLQGFSDAFIDRVLQSGVSNSQLYRQAGNAVSVNTAYAILYYIFSRCSIAGEACLSPSSSARSYSFGDFDLRDRADLQDNPKMTKKHRTT